ncbi:MAG TPA: SBBP repeat-containing protein [Chloroflexota bacterium]|nr:SBBP repeat-containing protein [Chloroflexota bacterium]
MVLARIRRLSSYLAAAVPLIALGPALAGPLAPARASAVSKLLVSTFSGGAGTGVGTGVAADRAGNIYVGGTIGAASSSRAFVTKYDPSGTHILYSTSISAPCGAAGNALTVDPAGNAYITGQYGVRNQFGICQITTDVLAAKLDPSGHLVYQKAIGPTSQDEVTLSVNNQGEAIAVDAAGNAYITGRADGDPIDPTIPVTPTALQRTGHTHVGFVMKVNPAGALVYSTFLGGNGTVEEGKGIAVDGRGDAFVTGSTQSSNFPTTANAYQPHLGTRFKITNFLGNAFIVELNPTGSGILYGSYLGGGEVESGNAIAIDGGNNVYVTGVTASPNFPTTANAYDRTCGTDSNCNVHYTCLVNGCGDIYADDAFVVQIALNRVGTAALRYSTFMGGSFNDEGMGIAVDRANHIYVTGRAASPSGFPTRNAIQPVRGGGADAFVAAFDPARSGSDSLIFSTFLGGGKDDEAQAMSLGNGCIYVTGDTASADFPTHAAVQKSWTGAYGAFLTKLSR